MKKSIGVLVGIFLISIALFFSIQGKSEGTEAASHTQHNITSPTIDYHTIIHHIAQMDRSQYASDQEYETWAGSACSATSMTVALDAYGNAFRITDILHFEIAEHAIDPQEGLLTPSGNQNGIEKTLHHFAYQAINEQGVSYPDLISLGAKWPVIIGVHNWPGDHILVETGGDQTTIHLVDSAPQHITQMDRTTFLHHWSGMAFAVMPGG